MKNKKYIIGLIIILIILGLYLVLDINQTPKTGTKELEVYFFDVGQGDSTFIKLPNKETILIDGATKSNGGKVIYNLEKLKIDTIDYLVATHPHEDHIGGLPEIIRRFDVKNVYLPNKTNNTKIFEEFLMEIKNNNINTEEAKLGYKIIDNQDFKVEFIGPDKIYKDINNNSALVRIKYGDFKSIFMGDAEKASEKSLIENNIDIRSNVLRVGHHGSDTSSTEEFIKKVNPSYSFISVGEGNRYKHPSNMVINRLTEIGSEVFRTDKDGTIKLSTDGKNIRIEKNFKL